MNQRGRGNSNRRVLNIYLRLAEGKMIFIKEEVLRFDVSNRTIKRDIAEIRAALSNRYVKTTLLYNKKKNGYYLTETMTNMIQDKDVLVICKMILESRIFAKKKIEEILDNLLKSCLAKEDQKLIQELIANEKLYYTERTYRKEVSENVFDLAVAIKRQKLLLLTYQRTNTKKAATYMVEPMAIQIFNNYFYLAAYLVECDKEKEDIRLKEDYPVLYRADQIEYIQVLEYHDRLSYVKRFQDEEFRKRVLFAQSGPLTRIQLRYTGNQIDMIRDKLPAAEIKENGENEYIIDAEVCGDGILTWILSQGEDMELIKPLNLRDRLKEMLKRMLKKYEN